MNFDAHRSLACLIRLAQLQREPVDKTALQEAITSAQIETNAVAQISHIAQSLQTPKPQFFNQPDLTKLPAILVTENGHWDIIRGQNSQGKWVCESFNQAINRVSSKLLLSESKGIKSTSLLYLVIYVRLTFIIHSFTKL